MSRSVSQQQQGAASSADLEKREAALQRGWGMLEKEKERMGQIVAKESGFIELNVGGTLFSTSRGTLCAEPGTVLEFMFSGRWEKGWTRDANGRHFLDFDPQVFEILLNHLRDKTLSAPDEQLALPTLPAQLAYKQRTYEKMLQYLGFIGTYVDGEVGRFSKERTHKALTLSVDGRAATLNLDLGDKIAFAKITGVCESGKSVTLRVTENTPNAAPQFLNVGILPVTGRTWDEGYVFGVSHKYALGQKESFPRGEKAYACDDILTLTLDTGARKLTLENKTKGKKYEMTNIDASQQYMYAFGCAAAGLKAEILE